MDKTKIYLNLKKCTEKEQKHIFSLLPPEPHRDAYNIFRSYKYLQFIPKSKFQEKEKWMVDKQAFDKVELTYPEFIKLFEGGEGKEVLKVENYISIEELTKLCNDYNRNTLKITNLERDLEYKRSWSKESIAIKEIHKEVSHAQAIKENAKSKLQEIGIVF